MRHIWLAGEGGREMMDAWRLGGRSIAHGHAMEHLVPKEKYGESNSEFYAFSRGQPCFTHPGVMDHTWQNVHWIAGETNLRNLRHWKEQGVRSLSFESQARYELKEEGGYPIRWAQFHICARGMWNSGNQEKRQ